MNKETNNLFSDGDGFVYSEEGMQKAKEARLALANAILDFTTAPALSRNDIQAQIHIVRSWDTVRANQELETFTADFLELLEDRKDNRLFRAQAIALAYRAILEFNTGAPVSNEAPDFLTDPA